MELKNPLICALDLDDIDQVQSIFEAIGQKVGAVKIGPRVALRYPQLVSEFSKSCPVFLDFKFHDIPSTTVSAVRAAIELGASLITVHASAGPVAMKELAKLQEEYQGKNEVMILAVTVLTSFSESTLPQNWRSQPVRSHVLDLVDLVNDSGLEGVVCSPYEVSLVRKKMPEAYVVTPGVRMPSDSTDDQERIMSPVDAVKVGANAIVVGRPIVQAEFPEMVVDKIIDSLS